MIFPMKKDAILSKFFGQNVGELLKAGALVTAVAK
jgi:hypothetical protein